MLAIQTTLSFFVITIFLTPVSCATHQNYAVFTLFLAKRFTVLSVVCFTVKIIHTSTILTIASFGGSLVLILLTHAALLLFLQLTYFIFKVLTV